jgi:hypothetical protein
MCGEKKGAILQAYRGCKLNGLRANPKDKSCQEEKEKTSRKRCGPYRQVCKIRREREESFRAKKKLLRNPTASRTPIQTAVPAARSAPMLVGARSALGRSVYTPPPEVRRYTMPVPVRGLRAGSVDAITVGAVPAECRSCAWRLYLRTPFVAVAVAATAASETERGATDACVPAAADALARAVVVKVAFAVGAAGAGVPRSGSWSGRGAAGRRV